MRSVALWFAAGALAATNYPVNFGVDVILPRHSEVYKRVFPFPVVLAIHGAPDAWPEDLSIKLDLSRNLDPAKGLAAFETVWLNATNVRKGLPEDEGTYFATVGLLEAAGTPTRSNYLRYEIQFTQDCAAGGLAAQRMADEDLITGEDGGYGTVYFELDDDKGVEPDVSASKDDGERCASQGISLLIEGKESERCLVLNEPDYERIWDRCRVDFPDDLGERVAAKLLDIGKCANETTKSAEHDVYCNSKPILVEGQTVAAEDSDSEGGEGEGGSTGRGGEGGSEGSDGGNDSGAALAQHSMMGLALAGLLAVAQSYLL